MANSQIVKRYTTNKICCLATNTVKTDRKIRYGSEDALCCVAKDFRAQTFLKMLQCSPETSNTQWYSANLRLQYTSKSPAEYDFASDLIITSGSTILKSYDGTQQTKPLSFAGNYGILPNINAVNSAFAKKIDEWGRSQPTSTFFAFATTIPPGVVSDFEVIDIDIFHDSTWGNNTNEPLSVDDIAGGANVPFDSSTDLQSYTEDDTITTSACFTEVQLCTMKRVIDNYCKSCN